MNGSYAHLVFTGDKPLVKGKVSDPNSTTQADHELKHSHELLCSQDQAATTLLLSCSPPRKVKSKMQNERKAVSC